jgi:hypothetical protein
MEDCLRDIRRGKEGAEHLRACARRIRSEDVLSLEDVAIFLRSLGCTGFLGGGTFGAVFLRRTGDVAKVVPTKGGGADGSREFYFQKKFAALCLAMPPTTFQCYAVSQDEELCLAVTTMPLAYAMLHQRLSSSTTEWTQEELQRLGTSLRQGILEARRRGLVHNDLKCNNVALSSSGRVFFIDFGKSLDDAWLRKARPRCDAERALDLAAALDCWRLQASVQMCLRKRPEEDQQGLLSPLQELCCELLKPLALDGARSPEQDGWWKDQEQFNYLKGLYRSCVGARPVQRPLMAKSYKTQSLRIK